MAADKSQRTEKPTPRRLRKAREEGNVPRSKELSSALGLLALLIFCRMGGASWLGRIQELFAFSFTTRPELNVPDLVVFLTALASMTAMLLLPPLSAMAAAGVAGHLVQGPPALSLKPLRPDASKLNPVAGLRKVFRLRSWVELIKITLKLVLFTAIALGAVREALVDGLPGAPGAEGTLAALLALCGKVVLRVALLALALALLDLLFTRFDHARQLRMTKQEVKEERKEQEGDPLIKARLRSKQMALARSRMMADVPRATVVVMNPEHYAVALRYVPGEMDVPRLLAKGREKLAERIRALAAEHRIPVIPDPPLARALYRLVPVGGFVPERLFRAVAEVLALVLRRDSRRPAAQVEP